MTTAWLALVGIGLAGALTFALMYAWLSRSWHRTAVGRNLMAESLVLAGLFGLTLSSLLFRFPAWVWLTGMASLDVVLWVQVWLLWRAQRSKP